ncbi:UDP-N-acetylmuramate dehydrogenase [Nesterenkonia alba]|uniref:UDP-N-acetylmuramate dehydrogenase n=1 Tax=Nesterenkonia alba TaxID=515814 RepID=UPI0003B4AA15|nr:UDP-N-acetylmuramate dehydrogenase [Nesterenkonia alba]
MTTFREHTTARVGGPAGEWITAYSAAEAREVLAAHPLPDEAVRAAGDDTLLVLGGGSNLLVSEEGFSGTVLQLGFTGITVEHDSDDAVEVTFAAGQNWDEAVAWAVENRLSGIEALAGIPGSCGATPVQNVGAYGSEVAHTLVRVRAWDRAAGAEVTLSAEQLGFAYRDSMLKRTTISGSVRYVVLSVTVRLQRSELSAPVRYAELIRRLGLDDHAPDHARRAPLEQVRRTVLALRAGKGMVLDPQDQDTWSTGSFFTNPIVPASLAHQLPDDAPRFPAGTTEQSEVMVKLSAAWLIDRAGCGKGFGAELTDGRASLSTKHTLAVTNRGKASTEDLLTVARAARDRVREAFGIELHPEPVLIGCSL